MSAARHGLRRRLVAAFALFALATALCFSVVSVLFVYSVEDSLFANLLEREAKYQQGRAAPDVAAPTRLDFVTLHASPATFPADLARPFRAHPQRREFAGEQGRHYHLRRLAPGQPSGPDGAGAYLVAEVGAQLVVRPRLPSLLAILAYATLASLGVTLTLGYWLARRATAPLTRLADLLARAAPGQLPPRFAEGLADNEIATLARALEQAMARSAAFIEREQHFTRDASHELRTPLAVVEGAAELLAQQALAPAAADQVQRIRSAAAHMTQTVATLLSLAREETSPAPPESFALLPLIESTVLQFAYLLDGKAAHIEVDVAPRATLHGHRPVLAILLSNVISNAFSHAGGGTIRIFLEGECLVVADNGPGIEAALYRRLYQAGAKGAASGGYGLGLSIAQRLGERFGIALSVENGAAGGTRAVLRFGPDCGLPPAPASAPAL